MEVKMNNYKNKSGSSNQNKSSLYLVLLFVAIIIVAISIYFIMHREEKDKTYNHGPAISLQQDEKLAINKTLYQKDGITVDIVDIYSKDNSLYFNVYAKNETAMDVNIGFDKIYINDNGIPVLNDITVLANHERNATVAIKTDVITSLELKNFNKIELGVYLNHNSNNYFDAISPKIIYTISDYQKQPFDGKNIYDKDGIKIYYRVADDATNRVKCHYFIFENNSTSEYVIGFNEININDTKRNGYVETTLRQGKNDFIYYYERDEEYNNIQSLEAGFNLKYINDINNLNKTLTIDNIKVK